MPKKTTKFNVIILVIKIVLFNIFDLESNKIMQFKELVHLFISLIRGFAILTGQPLPEHANLQKYGQIMFSRADLNNDQNL